MDFSKKWLEGNDVVYGLREKREGSKKLGMQKRSGVGSRRLKAIQFKKPSPKKSATKKKIQKSRMVKV